MSPFATDSQIEAARQGKTLVTTNGVFDVLHVGHLDLLTRAKALGDLLVVALNTDASVRRLGKGPGRPVNPLEERAAMVLALKPVDFVVWFDEDTPERLLATLKPEIHAKGGDYEVDDLPEAKVVAENGGRTVVLPFVEGRSSTRVLDRLRTSSSAED